MSYSRFFREAAAWPPYFDSVKETAVAQAREAEHRAAVASDLSQSNVPPAYPPLLDDLAAALGHEDWSNRPAANDGGGPF